MCVNCKKEFLTFKVACKVCQLLDGDNTIKWVTYCDSCKAYICEPCSNDWVRRGKAFIKNIIA